MNRTFETPVMLICNGPRNNSIYSSELVKNAGTIICLDGAADKSISLGIEPDIIIGDLDSLTKPVNEYNADVIHFTDQETTDLEKALNWCEINGLRELSIIGFFGGREDHTLANFTILNTFAEKFEFHVYSENSQFTCFKGSKAFESFVGQEISILSFQNVRSVSTTGLKYELINEEVAPGGRGISNVSISDKFTVISSNPIWVFCNYK